MTHIVQKSKVITKDIEIEIAINFIKQDRVYRLEDKWPLIVYDNKKALDECHKKFSFLKEITQFFTEKSGIIIAGGSICDIILDRNINDIDIFFYGIESELTIIYNKLVLLLTRMKQNQQQSKSRYVHNFYIKKTQLQLITKIFPTKDSIIGRFDLACSSALYDFNEILMTPIAEFTYINKTLYVDFMRCSDTFATRIQKYEKKGFEIVCPEVKGFDSYQLYFNETFDNINSKCKNIEDKNDLYIEQTCAEKPRTYSGDGYDYPDQTTPYYIIRIIIILFFNNKFDKLYFSINRDGKIYFPENLLIEFNIMSQKILSFNYLKNHYKNIGESDHNYVRRYQQLILSKINEYILQTNNNSNIWYDDIFMLESKPKDPKRYLENYKDVGLRDIEYVIKIIRPLRIHKYDYINISKDLIDQIIRYTVYHEWNEECDIPSIVPVPLSCNTVTCKLQDTDINIDFVYQIALFRELLSDDLIDINFNTHDLSILKLLNNFHNLDVKNEVKFKNCIKCITTNNIFYKVLNFANYIGYDRFVKMACYLIGIEDIIVTNCEDCDVTDIEKYTKYIEDIIDDFGINDE